MGLRGPGARSHGTIVPIRGAAWQNESLSRADKVIAFVESLKLTADPWAGHSFLLRAWQQEIIRSWYSTDEDGRLMVKTGLLSVARKNGKSGLVAGLAACHLLGPEAVTRGEIVVGATDSDQSGIIFSELVAFIEDNREFYARCNIKRHEKKIENLENGSVFKALSSDAKKAHGLNPTVVIMDELAQWGDGVGRRLYDALTTGQGARRDPITFIIGTQAAEDNALMSQLVDYAKSINSGEVEDVRFSGFVYEIPEDADVFDPANWPLGNPALGDFRSLDDMQDLAVKAKRLPTVESTFRNLNCNQRTQAEPGLVTKAEWLRCRSSEVLQERESIYIGMDLSARSDLTALVACSADNGDRLKAWFWKPGSLLQQHIDTDRIPYDIWVKDGWIAAPHGRSIDYRHIAQTLVEIHSKYTIKGIAYDRYRIDVLKSELDKCGVAIFQMGKEPEIPGALPVFGWGQGYADMAPAVDAFEVSVLEEHLKHDGNPVLTMCVANAKVDMDAAGNRKLDKSATRFRIDGAVAATMAIGLKVRNSVVQEAQFQAFVI